MGSTYYVDPGNANVTTWQANHAYSSGEYICPTNLTTADAKSVYECTTAGTSHATTEPTWDETVGNTTSDGSAVWTARAPDSWEEALKSIRPAAALAAAGDTVYCRGTETITAEVDFAANGTYDAYIKFIGCNASGTNDGTFYNVNGADGNINGFDVDGDYLWFENFKIYSCDGTAAIMGDTSATDFCVYINVWCDDNAAYGFYGNGSTRYANFIRCRFSRNTSGGFYRSNSCRFFACSFDNNTGVGYIEATGNGGLFGCVFRDNTTYGASLYGTQLIINCIFEDNGADGCYAQLHGNGVTFIGCRFTNNNEAGKYGLNVASGYVAMLLGCYFGNNATAITGQYQIIPINGSITNVDLDGGEIDEGYVTAGSDFNLDATKAANTRSIAVPLNSEALA